MTAEKVCITVEVPPPPRLPPGYLLEAFAVSSPVHKEVTFGPDQLAHAAARLLAVGHLHGELVAYCGWTGPADDPQYPVQYRCWWQHREGVWGKWVA